MINPQVYQLHIPVHFEFPNPRWIWPTVLLLKLFLISFISFYFTCIWCWWADLMPKISPSLSLCVVIIDDVLPIILAVIYNRIFMMPTDSILVIPLIGANTPEDQRQCWLYDVRVCEEFSNLVWSILRYWNGLVYKYCIRPVVWKTNSKYWKHIGLHLPCNYYTNNL